MIQTTIGVDGMQCSMCEEHVKNAISKVFPEAKKITVSKGKKNAVILSEAEPDEAALKKSIDDTGYTVTSYATGPYERKGFFSKLFG